MPTCREIFVRYFVCHLYIFCVPGAPSPAVLIRVPARAQKVETKVVPPLNWKTFNGCL